MNYIITKTEAHCMLTNVIVTLSVYATVNGGVWYATVSNGVEDNGVIELCSNVEGVSELVDALMSAALKYDTIAARSKRSAEREAASATCAALNTLAAGITLETACVGIVSLHEWLVSKGL